MAAHAHPRLARRDDGRIVAGVAAGLGAYFGIDANIVRIGFVVLSLAGGLGIIVYAVGWMSMPAPVADEGPPRREPDAVQAVALGAVVLGSLLLARTMGIWPGDAIVWPLVAAAVGLGLLWMRPMRGDAAPEPLPWPALERLPPAAAQSISIIVGTRRGAYVRMAVGLALVAGGILALVLTAGSWDALRSGLFAGAIVVTGLALLVGPGLSRLAAELVDERRERIRSDERADVAAHLHDSVLQTLALVQRRADDPREVVRLARRQERELRAWLLGDGDGDGNVDAGDTTLGEALEVVAAAVEEEYGVPVEVVRVRDCPASGLEPLLAAAREGMLNAARHSGAPEISVYLEVDADDAVVFIRDRGRGFDPAAVPADRGGLAVSITSRLSRHGGAAHVRTAPGEGTELELSLSRRAANHA